MKKVRKGWNPEMEEDSVLFSRRVSGTLLDVIKVATYTTSSQKVPCFLEPILHQSR